MTTSDKLARAGLLLALLSAPAAALQHTVVPGDHLWGLAGHYYKNNFRWKAIYAANKDKIKDPHWIYPGQVFEIPEVPGPEIGELPARPVETEAAAKVPAPAPVQAQASKPAAETWTAPTKSEPPTITDDLSVKLPEGMTGQYPSMTRIKTDKSWKEDGKVSEFEGRELLAAEGDWFVAKFPRAPVVGDRYQVLRHGAAQELDEDPKANYLQSVGWAQVKAVESGKKFRLVILKSVDTVQVGDLLKKEGSR